MGMSVHLYQVVQDTTIGLNFDPFNYDIPYEQRSMYTELRNIPEDDESGRLAPLFERFKAYTYEKTYQEHDFEKSFAACDLNYDDYEFIDVEFGEDDLWSTVFVNIHDGSKVRILDEDFLFREVKVTCLLVEEINTYKRCYKKSFWDWSKLEEWDEDDRRPNAIDFIIDDAEFQTAKEHFESRAPIHDWEYLDADQILYFSW